MRPGDDPTAAFLMVFTRPVGSAPAEEIGRDEALLVRWSPDAPSRTRLAYPQALEPHNYTLNFATTRASLLTTFDGFTPPSLVLVDFATNAVKTFDGPDLSNGYVLLAPEFLYSTSDTRFHTPDTGLSATSLPAPLAPAPVTDVFDTAYHLVGMP
jgi:hypothetical protein